MFGIGFTEIIAVGVIALIFIGPEDLPRVARNIAKLLNEFKRGRDHFVNEIKASSPLDSFKSMESHLGESLHHFEKPLETPTTKTEEKENNESRVSTVSTEETKS
jgi:Sec-independent protein translocase protein TatA